ncbi:hypothetical protein BC826DRAFT_186888 [Russula brevipes]|nr:hypothetical protein BC826DRAFT_186888 [Russula brevipes]
MDLARMLAASSKVSNVKNFLAFESFNGRRASGTPRIQGRPCCLCFPPCRVLNIFRVHCACARQSTEAPSPWMMGGIRLDGPSCNTRCLHPYFRHSPVASRCSATVHYIFISSVGSRWRRPGAPIIVKAPNVNVPDPTFQNLSRWVVANDSTSSSQTRSHRWLTCVCVHDSRNLCVWPKRPRRMNGRAQSRRRKAT